MTRPFKGMLTTVKVQEFNCSSCCWKKGFEVYPSDCLKCTDYSWAMKPAVCVDVSDSKVMVIPFNGYELGEKMVVNASELKPLNEMSRTWNALKEYGIEGIPYVDGRLIEGGEEE